MNVTLLVFYKVLVPVRRPSSQYLLDTVPGNRYPVLEKSSSNLTPANTCTDVQSSSMDTVASASINANASSQEQRCLWIHRGAVISSISNNHVQNVTYESIYQQYAIRPKRRPLFRYVANSIVVVQEFVLTCYFLGWHRYLVLLQSDSTFLTSIRPFHGLFFDISTTVMYVALLLAVIFNARAITASQNQMHPKNASTAEFYRSKVMHRLVDAVILAFLLRFVSALLHDLTVSYSTDTVELLAALAMILHLIFCDYSYANGYRKPNVANATDAGHAAFGEEISVGVERQLQAFENHRPSFMGGAMSLNAAFFATVLLISRFEESNTVTSTSSFVFVSLSVILFAFYPVARHTISVKYPPHRSGTFLAKVLWSMDDTLV